MRGDEAVSKAIEFGVVADRIVAISGAVHYLWVAGIADGDYEGRRRAREEYEAAHPGVNVRSLSGTIRALLTDEDDLVDEAISADGRGHFIATYDGEEAEAGRFYVYRIN
jgi:hypothetical protein